MILRVQFFFFWKIQISYFFFLSFLKNVDWLQTYINKENYENVEVVPTGAPWRQTANKGFKNKY